MRYILYLSCLLFAIAGCSTIKAKENHPLLNCFFSTELSKNDTLVLYAEQEEWDSSKVKELQDTFLLRYLSQPLFDQLNFTGQGRYFAAQRFLLDEKTEACVVYTLDVWFKMTSLLLWNRQTKEVYGVVPGLAQYYGGESGQIYNYSWLFLHKNTPHIYTKTLEHWWLLPTDDQEEATEKNSEENEFKQWNILKFDSIAMADSSRTALFFRNKLKDVAPFSLDTIGQ